MDILTVFIICAAAVVIIGIAALLIYFENKRIDVTEYDICDDRLPTDFDGTRIVHISDLHNNAFGKNNIRLISSIKQARPEYIFITGDLIDSVNPDINSVRHFVRDISEIAPVYYCTGNHESRLPGELKKLERCLRSCGAQCLRNRYVYLRRGKSRIRLIGVDDPAFFRDAPEKDEKKERLFEKLFGLTDDREYNILLCHKPNFHSEYNRAGTELVFCGHAHGGQFRLPFGLPLYTPDEGLLPRYAQGVCRDGDTQIVVSRGLGQSVIPFRLNNSPELVVAVLHCGER